MFDIQNEVLEWGGKKLTIETGRIARQAHGSVIATYGGTSVLATVVADREEKKEPGANRRGGGEISTIFDIIYPSFNYFESKIFQ